MAGNFTVWDGIMPASDTPAFKLRDAELIGGRVKLKVEGIISLGVIY